LKFRRQVPIGNAIVDFVCFERHLVIELDGGQPAESSYDARRDNDVRRRGFRILRFWNETVMRDVESVLLAIRSAADGGPFAER